MTLRTLPLRQTAPWTHRLWHYGRRAPSLQPSAKAPEFPTASPVPRLYMPSRLLHNGLRHVSHLLMLACISHFGLNGLRLLSDSVPILRVDHREGVRLLRFGMGYVLNGIRGKIVPLVSRLRLNLRDVLVEAPGMRDRSSVWQWWVHTRIQRRPSRTHGR